MSVSILQHNRLTTVHYGTTDHKLMAKICYGNTVVEKSVKLVRRKVYFYPATDVVLDVSCYGSACETGSGTEKDGMFLPQRARMSVGTVRHKNASPIEPNWKWLLHVRCPRYIYIYIYMYMRVIYFVAVAAAIAIAIAITFHQWFWLSGSLLQK